MWCGASGELFQRKGQETQRFENPQLSVIAAVPWNIAA
jgi:hypothetical protein